MIFFFDLQSAGSQVCRSHSVLSRSACFSAWVRLTSLGMFSRPSYVVMHSRILFLFIAKYFTECIWHILSLPADFLAFSTFWLVSNAAINIGVYKSFDFCFISSPPPLICLLK